MRRNMDPPYKCIDTLSNIRIAFSFEVVLSILKLGLSASGRGISGQSEHDLPSRALMQVKRRTAAQLRSWSVSDCNRLCACCSARAYS